MANLISASGPWRAIVGHGRPWVDNGSTFKRLWDHLAGDLAGDLGATCGRPWGDRGLFVVSMAANCPPLLAQGWPRLGVGRPLLAMASLRPLAVAGHSWPWRAMAGHGRPWLAMAGHLAWQWPGHGQQWPRTVGHVWSICESKGIQNTTPKPKTLSHRFQTDAIQNS